MTFATVPFDKKIVDEVIAEAGISVGTASIREVNRVINAIEARLEAKFIRMEFGIPGLETNPIAIEAEIAALRDPRVANTYSPFDGLPILKEATRDFVKAFLDLDVPIHCCIPTHGAMHGGYIAMGVAGRRFEGRDTILFLDPGFPVNKLQCRIWGLRNESLDFYDKRGDALVKALEERLATGRVGGIMYSTPNNPTWVCFKESELEGIGRLCTEYGVIAIEDLAYFGMDFRQEYGIPFEPPYQPSVARYTDQYVLLVSSSKIFSYAGQRAAVAVVSPRLFEDRAEALMAHFNTDQVGHAFVHGGMYPTTAGVAASVQHGLAALFRACTEGKIVFTEPIREYAERAREMKKAFLDNGFELVYDNDLGEPLADGFYFTLSYGGLHCTKLLEELVYYGISAIGLNTAGSTREEGIRACVSLTTRDMIPELRHRLEAFHRDHSGA
ncbi:MAG: aminotransferase class I/II-fold pyridoxal phosphate-dependent enzyme [Planctomycetota bacterium]|jgi:aspartate/methionine/tyrosine aminotransferase